MFTTSVSRPVHLPSGSYEYASNALKLTHVIHVYCYIFFNENGVYRTDGSSAGTHKSIVIHYSLWVTFLKDSLTLLYSTKLNKINVHL